MKKSLLTLTIFVICFFLNKIISEINTPQQKHAQLIKTNVLNKTLEFSKSDRLANQMPPNKYFEQKYLLEINPITGKTYPENVFKVKQELKKKRLLHYRTPGDGFDNQWVERGPNNVGGRTRILLYDPNDINHKRVFAGGVSGGLWVNDDITDEKSSWTQVVIDENLSVTCMAVDPNNPQILYLGTGELYVPQQALGNGIWKSTDGGNTWVNIYKLRGATVSGTVPGTYYTTDIVVRDKDGDSLTTNDSEVFISVGATFFTTNPRDTFVGINDYGIFKSTDEGVNWSRIPLEIDGKNVAGNDFEIGIDNTLWLATTSNIFGKGGGSIYNSIDGDVFSLKHTIPNGRRTEISVSKQNPNTMYVLSRIRNTDVSNNLISPFVSILKTVDAFATVPTELSLPVDTDVNIPDNDFTRGQAFYNLMIEVDPTNDEIAYAGGIDLFRTTDSGNTWKQISKWSESGNLSSLDVSFVHADQHIMVFNPLDSNSAIIGNDGGVYYASNLSSAFEETTAITARNKDYNTAQLYYGAISKTTTPSLILGGAQDNGSHLFNNATSGINSSIRVNGGDGTQCFINKDNSYMIVSSTENRIRRLDLPYPGTITTIASDGDTGDFFNAMALDDNFDILYTNGSDHLARFKNITSSSPIRDNIKNALLKDITAIKVSPFTQTSSKVFLGTRTGKIVKVENANTSTQIITDISSSSFLGSISSISFGANENEIMVTFYNFGVDSIWYTDNGGLDWVNKEGNFPDITVRDILMNPLNNNEVIIATELGVWNTHNFKDSSPKWNHSYNGMSNVTVTSLSLRDLDNTILATTFGRGFYTGQFTGKNLTNWTGAIDADWNKIGNWSNGIPTRNTDVRIPNTSIKPIINTTVLVANILLEKEANLTISDLGALTVEEDLTNSGIFTIESSITNSGSLIVKGKSTGKITYNRAVGTNWHLISSPVINQYYNDNWVLENSIASGRVNINQRGIGRYSNNLNVGWQYMLTGESFPFVKGEGYTILRKSAGNLTFTGNILTESTTKTITQGTNNSFNILGNVYPSHIPINFNADNTNNFLSINSAFLDELTVWLWDGTSYNAVNQILDPQFIAPGQAFFVRSKPGGATVTFTKEMQKHNKTVFLKKKQIIPEIKISVSNSKDKKQANIFYIKTATNGFDNGFDSSLYSNETNGLEVYTELIDAKNKNLNLSIQSIPEDFSTVIPIGIMASSNQEISIQLISKNLASDKNIYLEDRELGVFKRLGSPEASYKFINTESTINSGRFFIHTLSKRLNVSNVNLSEEGIFYSDNKIFFIKTILSPSEVNVYDTKGSLMLSKKINNVNFLSVNYLPKGVYVVTVENKKRKQKKKIIID